MQVSAQDVPVSVEYVAQTQSSQLVNIQARVSGFLDKRMYTEGTTVREGEVLFQMDAKPFKTQLEQSEAALAKQEAALETARLNLARIKPLTSQNALSQKDKAMGGGWIAEADRMAAPSNQAAVKRE